MDFSDFLLRVCHDLRAPLRKILLETELLARNHVDVGQGIPDGARQLSLLADALAAYAIALQTDESSFQPAQMDFLLRLVLAKLDKELRERDAVVTYDQLPRIWGDPDRLTQLLEILLLNAVRHRGDAAPRVHVAAAPCETGWQISVRDNGPGVELPYLEKIFRPLERLYGYEQSDAGMGLAICREIVERHGGRIWVESQPGQGAAFCFTLRAT